MMSDRITDGMIQTQLERASSYSEIPLKIHQVAGRYVLVDETDNYEITRYLTRSEIYEALRSINELYYRVNIIKLRRWKITSDDDSS
jgi:hypothetical protein